VPLSAAAPLSTSPSIAPSPTSGRRVSISQERDWRLHKHADYQRVYQASRKQFSTSMTYFVAAQPVESAGTGPRVGITAGKVLGKAVERIFLPLMRLTLPEIVDVNLPVEGVFHNLMIVSIRKSYPGHARKVMSGIWALGQAMFTKCIVVVDEDVNVQDIGEVVLKVFNNIDPERDIQFTLGPVDSLDHAARLTRAA